MAKQEDIFPGVNTLIACESVVCGIAVYICFVLWLHLIRENEQPSCDCKMTKKRVENIMLSVSCTVFAVSEIMGIAGAISLKRHCSFVVDERKDISQYSFLNFNYTNKNFSEGQRTLIETFKNKWNQSGGQRTLIEMFQYNWNQSDFKNFFATGKNTADRHHLLSTLLPAKCGLIYVYLMSVFHYLPAVWGFVVLTIYTVIWQRQRTFYQEQTLAHLSNKITRFISKYFIVYMTVDFVFVAVFMLVESHRTISHIVSGRLTWMWMVVPWTIQFPLLILFIYPLIKNMQNNSKSNIPTDHKYVRLLKRVTILTTVVLVTDTTMSILLVSFLEITNVIQSMNGLNLLINLICVNLIATDWKLKLFPWFVSCQRAHQGRQETLPLETMCANKQFLRHKLPV